MSNDAPATEWKPILEGHNPRLDGVRGLAIFLVLCTHLLLPWQGAYWLSCILNVLKLGWCGVDLFFVLSGFLITGILLRNKDSRESTAGYFLKFEARRIFRIFPLYYTVLFIVLVLIPASGLFKPANDFWHFGKEKEQIWYWLYLSNFRAAYLGEFSHRILAVTWSLAIEEQYYVLWPTIVFFLSRRSLIRLAAALILTANLFRFGMLALDFHYMSVYTFTLSRMDGLAMGGLIALLIREPWGERLLRRWMWPAVGLSMLVLATLMSWAMAWGYEGEWYDMESFLRLGLPALVFLFGGTVAIAVLSPPGHPVSRFFEWGFLKHLGKYSYAIYLFHVGVRIMVEIVWIRLDPEILTSMPTSPGHFLLVLAIFFATCFALTMLLCYLSWWALESRFLALKRYFAYRRG